jgi:hypothetical protein
MLDHFAAHLTLLIVKWSPKVVKSKQTSHAAAHGRKEGTRPVLVVL